MDIVHKADNAKLFRVLSVTISLHSELCFCFGHRLKFGWINQVLCTLCIMYQFFGLWRVFLCLVSVTRMSSGLLHGIASAADWREWKCGTIDEWWTRKGLGGYNFRVMRKIRNTCPTWNRKRIPPKCKCRALMALRPAHSSSQSYTIHYYY
jgi:hypothetical protein